jgi:hypothetical protein
MDFKLLFGQVNWWAVIVSTLAILFLGGLWYQALFGKAWIAFMGFTDAQMAEMKAKMKPPTFFGTMIVCYFVLSVAFALIIHAIGIHSAAAGATLGAVIGIGFAATIGMTDHISSNRHVGVYYINTMYQLLFLMSSGAILGGWQ